MRYIIRILPLLLVTIVAGSLSAQTYMPKKPNEFEIKSLKGKYIYLPVVDKVSMQLKEEKAFFGLTTDKQIDNLWEKTWTEGIQNSVYDFSDYRIIKYNRDKAIKQKDKVAIILYFEKDFNQNWFAYLAVAEPKFSIIASAVVNDLKMTNSDDITLMFNLLTYSMVNAAQYYGNNTKPLYRGHKYKYKIAMDEFSDDLKTKILLVPEVDKKENKKYKKFNNKTKEWLKENWKLTGYQFINYKKELKATIDNEDFTGYYFRIFKMKTANPKILYNYYVLLNPKNQNVIYTFVGQKRLTNGNLKYIQDQTEKWLYEFMDQKKRKQVEQKMQAELNKQAAVKSKNASPKKASPKKATPKPVKQTPKKDKNKGKVSKKK